MTMNYHTDDETSDASQRQVPASSRGGLGNIRARKQSKLDVKDTSRQSSLSISGRLSISTSSSSRIRRVLSVGSNSTMSSASSEYSNVNSAAVTVGSGAASVTSGSSGRVSEDYAAFPDSGSPLSVAFPSPGSGRTGGKGKGKVITSASVEYSLHLQTDAQQRALEKRVAKARAREESKSLGQPSYDNTEKVVKARMGRGGAGVYRMLQTGLDPTLHPRAATITQEYEARAAAQEREIIAASRVRSALKGSTGRGGAGNVGFGGKTARTKARKEKKRKDLKGKERARADVHDAGENGEGCIPEAREHREADDDATIATSEGLDNHRKKRPRLHRLLRRVIRPNTDIDSTLRGTTLCLDDSTPRASMTGDILEIGRPSARSHWDLSSSSSSLISPQPSRMPRVLSKLREETREGAELLALVNAVLPDLPSAQNVLGVPGTPGFPRPGGRSASKIISGSLINQSTPSSRSSTPHSEWAPARTGDSDVFQEVDHRPFRSGGMEGITEEEWVDDEMLQENAEDEHSFVEENDEEEDSDIDPQLMSSAYEKQQSVFPEYGVGNRHDSLDAVILVTLDKLDRIEMKDKVDNAPMYDEAGIIGAYESTGDEDDRCRGDWADLHPAPIPAPLILPPAPQYLPASAPALPARFYNSSRGVRVTPTRFGDQSGRPRTAIPVATPPPTRPVPRIPGQN